MKWQQFRNCNAIRSIVPEFDNCYFVSFNKIKVQEVIDYLNNNDIKTQGEAWKYINTLTDYYKCNVCHKDIPYLVTRGENHAYGTGICPICKEKQDNQYKEERNNLIGKQIIKVDCGERGEGGLTIYLNDDTIINIADGEYGDDCSRIIKGVK